MPENKRSGPFDAIVVGGGPAGLSAGSWLGRYRRRVLVVDSGDYRNASAERAHGYLGRDPVSPAKFRDEARTGLLAYPSAAIVEAQVIQASRADEGSAVETRDEVLRSRRLVLATGVRDAVPEVDNFFEHYGASAFHCPSCDGYEARDRQVVVIGWSEDVTGFAIHLLDWAASVTVVTDGVPFEGDQQHRDHLAYHDIAVVEGNAAELLGTRGDLRGVRMHGGVVLPCDLVFFSIEHQPNIDVAQQLDLRAGRRRICRR